jgi:hypothetical protein
MYRFSSRSLQWARRVVKVIGGLSTFVAGIFATILVRDLSVTGWDALAQSSGQATLVYFIAAGIVCALARLADDFWLEPATRDANVIIAAMRHLYETLFGLEPGHRITFLALRTHGQGLLYTSGELRRLAQRHRDA